MRATDATAVPCGMSRETVKRSDLAGACRLRLLRLALPVVLRGLKLYLVYAGDGVFTTHRPAAD